MGHLEELLNLRPQLRGFGGRTTPNKAPVANEQRGSQVPRFQELVPHVGSSRRGAGSCFPEDAAISAATRVELARVRRDVVARDRGLLNKYGVRAPLCNTE